MLFEICSGLASSHANEILHTLYFGLTDSQVAKHEGSDAENQRPAFAGPLH
jgi:hypothetical protein